MMAKNTAVWIIIVALVATGAAFYTIGRGSSPKDKESEEYASGAEDKEVVLRDGMRKLWEDHVTWTRLYIVEAVAGLPGAKETAARLLKNQEDIGNAIKPYYGAPAGDKLTALLKDHINGAVGVLSAAKAGDNGKLEAANKKWYANADDIASFLSAANPKNWPLADMKAGMKTHLDLTLAEAVAELKGKYSESVADYDSVHEHILGMSDILSAGIVKQFPDKF